MKSKLTLAIIAIAIIFSSCSKDSKTEISNIDIVNKEKEYHIKDGVMVFKNQESFDKIFNYLNNKDETVLNKWNDSLKFKSYRITHSIDSVEKEISMFNRPFNPLDLPHLSSILNADGVFIISDIIHQYKDGKEVTLNLNSVDNNLSLRTITKNLDVYSNKIETLVTVKALKRNANSLMQNGLQTNSSVLVEDYMQYITCPGRPERIFYQSGIITSGAFIQCVAHVFGEAYRKGGLFGSKRWRPDEFAYVGLDITYQYYVYDQFNQLVGYYSSPYSGFFYTAYGQEQRSLYTPNFYSALGPNQHFEDVFISSRFEAQKSSCTPVETFFR